MLANKTQSIGPSTDRTLRSNRGCDPPQVWNRRNWIAALCGAGAVGGGAVSPTPLQSQETGAAITAGGALYVDDRIDQAIDGGIDYLVRTQRSDGSITDSGHQVAMTSLAIMSMAAVGVVASDPGDRGAAMAAALGYVLQPENQDAEGYFGRRDGSRMYGHGITTLMLTELLGMGASVTQNDQIHRALVKSIALILAAQNVNKERRHQGGWRYAPDSRDSDLSVSVWQLMALRSAKNDGMNVPGEAIDAAIEYLENSYTTQNQGGQGGFTYTPGSNHATFTMTAAGLLAMQVCGQYERESVAGAADWLLAHEPETSDRFFFYGIYYYAQGMHQFGGQHADTARKKASDLLLDFQREDGSFAARGGEERNIGSVYCTAMALLSLTVRYHYLPIYQR